MLTIVYLRIYNSLLFSIALLYLIMLHTNIFMHMFLDQPSSLFSVALLYCTMLHTNIHMHMFLDCLSSSTIYYTVPCRLCTLTYSDPWSYRYRTMQTLHAYVSRPLVLLIYTQASTLASPLIYNYPSLYSSGLFHDNLY